jgi:gamma-glutamylcysteine synthetase
MSTVAELKRMNDEKRRAAQEAYNVAVKNERDGKPVDLVSLADAMSVLNIGEEQFEKDVADARKLLADIAEARTYADVRAEYSEAVQAEQAHTAAREAYQTAATKKAGELQAASGRLRNEVQRVGAIRRSLINRGVIKDDAE